MAEDEAHEVVTGEGYAVGNIDALGNGGGFRKIRPALTSRRSASTRSSCRPSSPAGATTTTRRKRRTSSTRATPSSSSATAPMHRLGPGGIARIDAETVRRIRNVGDGDLIYVAVGGKDGYVENDGHLLPSEETG